MGNYNPMAPVILGEEWVPILERDVTFSPAINTQEQGHGFTLSAARQASRMRYYINDLPGTAMALQTALGSIYPRGLEDVSGPIYQVVIPVSQGVLSGAGAHLTAGGVPPTVATALRTPGDGNVNSIFFDTQSAFPTCDLNFDTPEYPELSGKRILNVSLLYSGYVTDQDATATAIKFVNPTPATNMTLVNFAGQSYNPSPAAQETGALTLNTELLGTAKPQDGPINELNLGDVFLRNASGGAVSIFGASPIAVFPWTYADLLRMHQSSGSVLNLTITGNCPVTAGGANTVQCFIDYVALKVTYCEETRLAYGARIGTNASQQLGMQEITLGMVNTKAANPILPAGDYTMTLTYVNPGAVGFNLGIGTETAELNGLQQLYPITSHPGLAVNIPFPLDDHIGDPLTKQAISILPQLSLHATGGTLTEPHAYGRQIAAQVYGVNVARQVILDDTVGVATAFPQVRYYARRFGNTSIPLLLSSTSPTLTGTANQITLYPSELDALPEIADGWREVTRRFPTAPSMGALGVDPIWQWSALGELAGSRWEILGACAPAISGNIPGSVFQQVPAFDRLDVATYQPPAGSATNLTWLPQGCASPFVTGATADPYADAVLIFSQDPHAVTGVALSQLTQSVTGMGFNCGSLPCCIPSGLAYNRVTWGIDGGTIVVRDSFQRVVSAGWGSPDQGPGAAWSLTDVGTAYNVTGTEGTITPSAVGYALASEIVAQTDFDITAKVGVVGTVVAGTTARASAIGRMTDINNFYGGFVQQSPGGAAQAIIGITKMVAGVETVLAVINSPLNIDANGRVWIRFLGLGSLLKVKIWNGDISAEPVSWPVEVTDTSLTTGTRAGVGGRTGTNTGNTLAFDQVLITPPRYWFGSYELQRWDALTGDFQTIMLATDITDTAFNDYEARVGLTSVYRMRINNLYNFSGPWSSQVSGSPPVPGVSGGCADMTGALIFTTNAAQAGNANAAYIMQWESDTPEENFGLPEAGDIVFQQFYGRDGSVAFHGTERGLETFQRTLLLQGGAISLPSMANGKTIRDLAWGNYPYICVRDDLGNRWFGTVQIPNIGVRNNRQAYMATATITETTQTPFAVNP